MKLANNDTVFKRNEVGMHNTPSWVIYTMPLFVVLMFIGFVIVGFRGFKGNFFTSTTYIWSAISVVALIWGIFVDNYFNFYENCRYTFNKDIVKYEYDLNSDIVGSRKTVSIRIKSLEKIKVRGKKAILFGTFIQSKPRQADTEINKIAVQIDFSEKEEILNRLKNMI